MTKLVILWLASTAMGEFGALNMGAYHLAKRLRPLVPKNIILNNQFEHV